MTVVVVGYLRFPPEAIPAVRPHLRALVEATRTHDGCLAYDVAEDLFEPGLIRFSEEWPNEASLMAHLKAAHIEPWRQAARSMGLIERKFTAYDGENSRPV
ncbi:MAG: antibiotic biosynthesis monooxygenase [Acidobacteria bacterium]|jgi:quinol monooxygenase YgiN|nr:antibiotic biosynthesis monooxygenase [Acidobacteriota bacterium]